TCRRARTCRLTAIPVSSRRTPNGIRGMPEVSFAAGVHGIARALGDARPKLVRIDAVERRIRTTDGRHGLEAHHLEGIGVLEEPAHDARNLREVSPCHRDGRRGLEAPAGAPASAADQLGELRAEAV